MSGAGEGKMVCVTGASGYIASWLVKLLLERGYTVKGSVRDAYDPERTQHLTSLDGAKERLQLYSANLLEEGSFDAIVEGCEGVFHTASPIKLSFSNPEAELLEPAVSGTLNVLRSCANSSSVKRVVITSSMVAVSENRELKEDVVVDESWFSDPSYCEEQKSWYELSKTMAENAAWKFAKDHGIDVITIHPGLVIGPLLQPSVNSSAVLFLNLLKGVEPFPKATCSWVDVRDVAYAHVLALETPSASGRYCLVERCANASQIIKILHEHYPTHQFPDNRMSNNTNLISPNYRASNEKAKRLGVQFTPLEVSLKDAVEFFREKNLVSI
ncbi:cinnamoyl-CoA reductase 1-like isoform X1 [Coffea eugenioides]|uniref:cinnamoyl-CoA reductase 1-like isoform X1 n=1 Tax=Coffea eugenioides TaxID=49369 RepID=UPI000F606097|nr:cinnamoyl-CoA reductase 1-like isoform X1 [Coffea eugenioides]